MVRGHKSRERLNSAWLEDVQLYKSDNDDSGIGQAELKILNIIDTHHAQSRRSLSFSLPAMTMTQVVPLPHRTFQESKLNPQFYLPHGPLEMSWLFDRIKAADSGRQRVNSRLWFGSNGQLGISLPMSHIILMPHHFPGARHQPFKGTLLLLACIIFS